MLAVILCFSMTTSVMATPSPELDPVPPEVNLSWSGNGSWEVTFRNVEAINTYEEYGYNLGYRIDAYMGDEVVGYLGVGFFEPMEEFMYSVSAWINESGEYTIKAYSRLISNETGEEIRSEVVETSVKSYVRPDAELATPDAKWDAEKTGTLTFQGVENASAYRCRLYLEAGEEDIYCGWADVEIQNTSSEYDTTDSYYEIDLSDWFYETGEYYVETIAYSADISTIANSRYGKSDVLNLSEITEDVEDVIGDANSYENAEEGLEHLTENTTKEDLQVAMQTNEDVRAQIAELEEKYVTQNNISVEEPVVSEEAAKYVDAEEITMVGAALNAQAGAEVKLSIDKATTAATVPSTYKSAVQLDLKLLCDNQSISELKVPITITMPLPKGVSTVNLHILHYHDGATEGKELAYQVKDGYITFTVDGFSTFVFANEINQNTGNLNNTTNTTNTIVTSPKTGDSEMIWLVGILMFAFAGAVTLKKAR